MVLLVDIILLFLTWSYCSAGFAFLDIDVISSF